MSTIPQKGSGGNNNQEANRQQKIKTDITTYTDKIVAAMGKNQTQINEQLFWPEPEAQAQIISDFRDKGWTVTFEQARSGGWIRWS